MLFLLSVMLLGALRGKVQVPEGAVAPNCQQPGTTYEMCTKQIEKAEVPADTCVCCLGNRSSLVFQR